MDAGTIVITILGSSSLTVVITHAFAIKKAKAKAIKTGYEADGVHIRNIDDTIKIYQDTCDLLQVKVKELEKKYNLLEKKYNELLLDYAMIHRELENFRKGNETV